MEDITLFKTPNAIHLKKISKKEDLKKDDDTEGYLINTDEKTARGIIDSIKKKNKKAIIAVQGRDDAFNRRAIETLKINYLVMPEAGKKKDTLKQRDSGINHVVAKEAARKNISFVIDFSYLKSLEGEELAKVLARIIQNIKICRKAKAQIKLASFAKSEKDLLNEKDISGFLTSLGMSSQQVKAARKF
jgi:ribonuclease P/MRP protein subunit RPP1